MKTMNWNDPALRAGPLDRPVRVYQPNGYSGYSKHYTAIPLELLDWIRPMLQCRGLKVTTYYLGVRPPASWRAEYYAKRGHVRSWSVVSGTTRRANARYAKLLVTDPRTGKKDYL